MFLISSQLQQGLKRYLNGKKKEKNMQNCKEERSFFHLPKFLSKCFHAELFTHRTHALAG